jgi:cell division protein FtsN
MHGRVINCPQKLKGKAMSAPNTNIERQKRRHRGPLIGMALGVIVATIGFLAFTGYFAEEAIETPAVEGQQAPVTPAPSN